VTEKAAILCEKIVLGILLTAFVVAGGFFLFFAVLMSRWNCGGPGDAPFAQGYPPRTAKFKFILPATAELKGAAIEYFLTGPSGGYGHHAEIQAGAKECEVEVGNAEALKAIVYRTGHGFALVTMQTLTDAATNSVTVVLPPPVALLPLNGNVTAPEGKSLAGFKLEIRYEAVWGMEFFGIIDGIAPSFKVATLDIAEDGSFSARVPDFTQDAVVRQFKPLAEDELTLTLRDAKTGNVPYVLELDSTLGERNRLKVAGAYPDVVILRAKAK